MIGKTSKILSFDESFPDNLPENPTLMTYQGERVQLRGFWYPDEGILASETNLKSCCVKSENNVLKRVLVKGEIGPISPQRAHTLEGTFKIDPIFNEKGSLIQFYVLENANVVERPNHHFAGYLSGLSLIIGCFLLFRFYRRKVRKAS